MARTRIIIPTLLIALAAMGATYDVGPGRTYADLDSLPTLAPGDVVEIYGDHTYSDLALWDAGAPGNPITIRGIPVAGQRPVLSGGTNTLGIHADHYVIERAAQPDGPWEVVEDRISGCDDAVFRDTSTARPGEHYYRVIAVNRAGASSPSNALRPGHPLEECERRPDLCPPLRTN